MVPATSCIPFFFVTIYLDEHRLVSASLSAGGGGGESRGGRRVSPHASHSREALNEGALAEGALADTAGELC